MKTPCILVASCSEFEPESVIKEILKSDSLPEKTQLVDDVVGFDWHISTKYYTADVLLCATRERTIGDREFAEAVEAFVVYFDAAQVESFKLVKAWCPYLEQIEPETKMLVCDRCTDNHKVPRLEVQTWCIDNGFELVELNPDAESDSDVEDDFQETTGIQRVIQALHAHTWSNLQIIENPVHHSPYLRQLMQEEFQSKQELDHDVQPASDNTVTDTETDDKNSVKNQDHSNHSVNKCKTEQEAVIASSDVKAEIVRTLSDQASASSKHSEHSSACVDCTSDVTETGARGNITKLSENKQKDKDVKPPSKEETLDSLLQSSDMALFESLGDEDPGGESFEKLFERFARMKEQASNLPPEERRKYAEQVTIAFWRAMGGDEDEIGNLSDSD